jgi:translation elongation factor EF-1alpha
VLLYKELVKKSIRRKVVSAPMPTSLCSNYGLRRVVYLSLHNIIVFGTRADLDALEADITSAFKAKAEPVFNEYGGNKIDINRGDDDIATVEFTQPVLIKSWKRITLQSCLVRQRLLQYQGLISAKVTAQI